MIFLCVLVREDSNKNKKNLCLVENGLWYVRLSYKITPYNRELKHATFLSHGRQLEVNISHASGLSQIFKLIVSTSEKRLNNVNVVV